MADDDEQMTEQQRRSELEELAASVASLQGAFDAVANKSEKQPRLPPWNWREMSEQERRDELEELAEWVASLQEAYGRWVRLPPCWPLHRALREELAVFWYWRAGLDEAADAAPEEAVRWHQSLRASAQVWAESYGGCRHESLSEVDERRDEHAARLAATRPYLAQVLGRPRSLQPYRVLDDPDDAG